jgi:hypothetical protein
VRLDGVHHHEVSQGGHSVRILYRTVWATIFWFEKNIQLSKMLRSEFW